jgi:hypothetical protein
MEELETITIERIERDKYRWYHLQAVNQDWRQPLDIHLSPDELLELAAYVEENRAQIEQEQKEDYERNRRAWSDDMKDQQRIKDQWRAYRNDEPIPPDYVVEQHNRIESGNFTGEEYPQP